jgi:hypothetical protein
MRRDLQIVAMLLMVCGLACTPSSFAPTSAPAPKPALPPVPPAATSVSVTKSTPVTWEDTYLPLTAAPGAATDDKADARSDDSPGDIRRDPRTRLSVDPATPRRLPKVPEIVMPDGVSQDVFVSGLMLPVAFEFAPDGRQLKRHR